MLPHIVLSTSRHLMLFAGFAYSFTFYLLCQSSLKWWLQISCVILLFQNAKQYYKQHITLSDQFAVCAFRKRDASYWTLQLTNGQTLFAYLKKNTVVTQFLILLNFYTEERKSVTVIVTPDRVESKAYRQLLICLYHAKHRWQESTNL